MTQISLARALKLKNRLVGQVAKLGQRAVSSNSRLVTAKASYDTKEVFAEFHDVRGQLVEVKTKIQLANTSIVSQIIEIGELRSEIALLKAMNVTDGPVNQGRWSDDKEVVQEFVASIDMATRDRMVEALESDIDTLQDEIDAHNATTKIDLTFDL
jgi:hypothetical protein